MDENVTINRLRGFSALAVVCLHYTTFFPNVLTFLGHSLGNAYYGVSAFFCTSGFLITTSILKRHGQVANVDLYAFYVRRFSRIVPAVVFLSAALALLSTTTIERFVFHPPLTLQATLISVFTLRYNFYYIHGGGSMIVWAILWSLTIEEIFYLVYPLVAKIAKKTWCLAGILLVIAVYGPIYRRPGPLNLYMCFGCFDTIAIGCLTALATRRFAGSMGKLASWIMMAAGIVALVCIYALTKNEFAFVSAPTLIGLGAALVLYASQCAPFVHTKPSNHDPLVFLGRLSYEIYLFHATIWALLSTVLSTRYPLAVFVIGLTCVTTFSVIIQRLCTGPLNQGLRTWLLSIRQPRAAGAIPLAPLSV